MVLVSFSFLLGKTPQSFPVPKYVGDGGISAHSTCCRFHRSSFFQQRFNFDGKLRTENRWLEDNRFVLGYHLVETSFELLVSERVKRSLFSTNVWRGNLERFGVGEFCFFCPKKLFVACGFRTSTPWWTMCKLGCCLNIPKLALLKFPTISSLYHQLPKTPYNITKHHPSKTDLFEVKEDMAASYGHHHLVPMLSTFHTWSFNDSKKNSEKIWFRQLVTPRCGQKWSKMNWQPPSQTQIDGLDSRCETTCMVSNLWW